MSERDETRGTEEPEGREVGEGGDTPPGSRESGTEDPRGPTDASGGAEEPGTESGGEVGGRNRGDESGKGVPLELGVLLVVVLGISILFLAMIGDFLLTLILAGIFAGMARPVFLWLSDALNGRRRLASLLTVVGLLLLILIPLGAFLALVLSQAVEVSGQAGPWIQSQAERWPELTAWLQELPLVGQVVPDQEAVVQRASELATRAGSFVINNLGAATSGTVNLILQLFVMLYAVYFFLTDGPRILGRILYYTPLKERDERELVEQFVSVTRATIKGSILVGLIQGALAGSAFFFLGLPGAAFWSTVMAVLSIIPVLGSGIVWAPAAIILALTGRFAAGLGLAIWGVVVVGLVDNFLRPRFVGRDTKMHDLLVLLSTFGGLAMFGVVGFMIGPIVGALFLTAWRLYGTAFKGMLPSAPEWAQEAVEEV